MARIGVSFDQVKAIVDALEGEGKPATIQAVREALGTGSPNTIHKHLVALREARPVARSATLELPPDLVNALANELSKAASKARAEIEGELVQTQAEAVDLSAAGEVLETQLSDLNEQMTETAAERDAAVARAAAHVGEIARLVAEVERERALAGAAQTEAATSRLKIDSFAEKLETQAEEITRLSVALNAVDLARQDAEKKAAVALAKLEAQTAALAKSEAREQQSIKDGQVRLASVTADLEAVKKDLTAVRDETKKAASEAAELRGKLNAQTEARALNGQIGRDQAKKAEHPTVKSPPVSEVK